ncbi:MAG: methionine/alanine import family NSS transporter small subunit [Propionibacteriaceae bacterium]|jgi:hypothetical protein|nr:methionine/alanine import family NSS transporter small subunit [Propionibacteriaceae bacterium]
MSTPAVILLLLSIIVIWGGLIASAIFLLRKPELSDWPEGLPAEED